VKDVGDYRAHCSTLQHTATHCNTLHHVRDAVGYRVAKKYKILWITHLLSQMARFTGWIRRVLPAICENLYASAPPCSLKCASSVFISGLNRERECVRERVAVRERQRAREQEPTRQSVFVSFHHIFVHMRQYLLTCISWSKTHTRTHTRLSHKRLPPHTK